MKRLKRFWLAVFVVLAVAGLLGALTDGASAETRTMSWTAPTAYTDGTPIAPAPITYTAFWSTSQTLSTPHVLLNNGTATSVQFDPDVQGMVRGTTIYFSAYATVNDRNSENAVPFGWPFAYKTPNPPTDGRIVKVLDVEWVVPTHLWSTLAFS